MLFVQFCNTVTDVTCQRLVTYLTHCSLRQQASDMNKRKAVEAAQTAADLKLHLDKYHAQLKEAQQVSSDIATTLRSRRLFVSL